MRKFEILCAIVVAILAVVCVMGALDRGSSLVQPPSGAGENAASGHAARARLQSDVPEALAEDRSLQPRKRE